MSLQADALALYAGTVMERRLPERAIKLCAAAFFLLTGAVTLAQASGLLSR